MEKYLRFSRLRKIVLLMLIAFSLASCNMSTEKDTEIDIEAIRKDSIFKQNVLKFEKANIEASINIRNVLESREPEERYHVLGQDLYSSYLFPKLYIKNKFKPVWFTHFEVYEKAFEMIRFIENTEYHGLIPEDYHLELLKDLGSQLSEDKTLIFNGFFISNFDMVLSDAYFILASHLYHGKIDHENFEIQWAIRRNKPDLPLEENLLKMLKEDTVENSFKLYYPPHPSYMIMVKEAKKLKSLIGNDFTVEIDKKFTSIKPGDTVKDIPAIKRKLALKGFCEKDTLTDSLFYDDNAVEAIKKLQAQFGFNADGIIGINTIKALNISIEESINKLYINMERLRWMPDSLENRYILVNIADFSLVMMENNDTLLSMRTVVGKNYRKTPVFSSLITYLVFSPKWTVPPGIMRNDVIPAVIKDNEYLNKKNMLVYDAQGKLVDASTINWKKHGMRYIVRQAPGSQNALGKVKFMFPNKYNVYLHDTPTRGQFARDSRTFSSGCIRIEKPFELACVLLDDVPEWTPERIEAAMNSKTERTVVLKSPVGVYLYYLTAWANANGEIQYRFDVYDRDKEMREAMLGSKKK